LKKKWFLFDPVPILYTGLCSLQKKFGGLDWPILPVLKMLPVE
jgi:hypothetical protein